MKINFVPTIIAIAITLLIAYGFYSFYEGENKLLLTSGSFIFIVATLIMSIGVSYQLPRTTTNIRTVSGIFFMVALVSNVIFSFLKFSIPSYVITSGLLFLVYIIITYSIYKAKE